MAQPDRKPETHTDSTEKNPVRDGGVAPDDAATEDVTRDTYGFTESPTPESDLSPADARRRVNEILPD
jgi:hypothetical protein